MEGRIHSLESFGTVDGPGVRYVVFMQGCPMRCLYCHNPDTWAMNAGTPMDSSYIIEQYERNKSFYNGGGITVTGGEPLMQIDFLLDLFGKAKERDIHTCIDTSGIAYNPNNTAYNEKLDKLLKLTNLVMLDIKHIDPEKHKVLCSQPNDGILAFLDLLDKRGVDTWIRHVVVPGYSDDEKDLYNLGHHIGQYSCVKALDVLPYHTMGVVKYENLGIDYPLKGVKAMDPGRAIELKKIIIKGIKDRRAEDGIK